MLIEIQFGDEPKKEFQTDKTRILIGRSKKCDLKLEYPGISREHFILEEISGEMYVTDLDSTNGVLLNGERIPPNSPTLFLPYFQLTVNGVHFTLLQRAEPTENNYSSNSTRPIPYSYMAPPKKHVPVRTKDKKRSIPLLLLLGLIPTLAFYLFTKKKTTTEKPVVATPAVSTPAENLSLLETSEYQSVWQEKGCSTGEERKLCKALKKNWNDKESIIIKDKIYIFINITQEANSRSLPSPLSQKKIKQLLAHFSTHPRARELNQDIHVLGFETENDVGKLKYALVHHDNLPQLDDIVHASIFSRVYIDEEWAFNELIAPYVKLKKLD